MHQERRRNASGGFPSVDQLAKAATRFALGTVHTYVWIAVRLRFPRIVIRGKTARRLVYFAIPRENDITRLLEYI